MESEFLESAKKQFDSYKQLGERTFIQLPGEKLIFKFNEESNSIATIVKHLHGNMLSRWTDFLNSDGEKEWRTRDKEFDNDVNSRTEILKLWDDGWKCLFTALDSLEKNDLSKIIYIRNEKHTVEDAIIRQLAHYPYHIGQIVYIGKMIIDSKWKSLSIPKNKSKEFNAAKFSQGK